MPECPVEQEPRIRTPARIAIAFLIVLDLVGCYGVNTPVGDSVEDNHCDED